MEEIKDENTGSQSCGPDCACNTKKGLPLGLKIILFAVIILVAGSVLANSLLKKTHTTANNHANSYASVLASNTAQSLVSPSKKGSSGSDSVKSIVSLATLFSFASLDTVAKQYDGVLILVENKADDKTISRINEISQAVKSIGTRGINIGSFKLNQSSTDFKVISSQLAPPCAVVIIKGRRMLGVDSTNINEQKLIQACLAAMQPTSCCAAGSKCK